ncbi:zinc phosphodiesterase ELAC protein 2-like [Patiria miniata]|uniref:Zinc phosphodiesterase ELAC protein 2 n=1 Tax=Patiria miniata TaxID=46514 RepID=A0A914B0Q9_PATMI|nr:zinc phosphodiesterase ELAC protein 2-like [Patiria miniata]
MFTTRKSHAINLGEKLKTDQMFSPKLHHFVSLVSQESFTRVACCHRNVSCFAGVLGRLSLARGKPETEVRQLASLRTRLLVSSAPLFTCRTFPVSSYVQTRHHFQFPENRHQPILTPTKKMAEAQRQSFRAKHQKRHRRFEGAEVQERKLDRQGKVSIQVTGSGTRACPPSVLVIADSGRYLFNCGEGTQRLMFENRLRSLAKLEHIFYTRMAWENLGGSIGMMITLKNVGLPKLSLYGPQELTEFSKALQIFAKHEAIDLDVKPYTLGPFLTEVMNVTPVPLFDGSDRGQTSSRSPSSTTYPPSPPVDGPTAKEETTDAGEDQTEDDLEAESSDSDGKKRKAKDPFEVISQMAVKQRDSPSPKRRKIEDTPNMTIAYICKLHDMHGRLDVQKAKDMGLKPGPEYGLLKAGKAVTTPDGKEIKPEDVLQPTTPGAVFIILECPSEEFVESVVNNETMSRYQADCGDNTATLVLHMCPENVINDARYHGWMQRFGPTTEHLIFNPTCHSVTHAASRRIQAKLNLIHKDVFPLLPVQETDAVQQEIASTEDSPGNVRIHKAESYLRYHLRPHTGWDREFVQSPSNQPFIEEAMALTGFKERLDELGNQLTEHQQRCSTEDSPRYPEVVFLGTGSAMPNKERNVTGILLNLSKSQSMIMDCGEGTFCQLCRFYGDRVDDILANLQNIFVSHLHADHHGGLIQILRQWKRVMVERGEMNKNLILVGPKRMLIWLNNYHASCESFIHQMKFIELGDLSWRSEERTRHEQSLLTRLNLAEYTTVPVPHCFNSHGLVIQHEDGWKLVYSGDSMPSDNLIQAGKDADVLIHEATLEDGLEAEAQKKRHSMISQAIDVGQQMGAKFTLLTHFSQRYPKIPFFDEQLSHRVGMAFDNMRVSLYQLDQLPLCLEALKHVFTTYIQEMQETRDKKAEKETILPLQIALKIGKVVSEETNSDGKETEGQATSAS